MLQNYIKNASHMIFFFILAENLPLMKSLLFILSLLFVSNCFAQTGYVQTEQDDRIGLLIQRQKDIHALDNTIDGYRIQIFMESGNEAVEHANVAMEEFKAEYPDIPIYLIFGQPYYRLRVGDYRTRLEAEKAFQTISKKYKNAFVTGDRIQLPYNIFCDTTILIEEPMEDYIINTDTLDIESIYYDYE